MRLIFGFIFFGLLFYLMWIYYPDAFQVLVSWAAMVVDTVKGFFDHSINKPSSPPIPAKSLGPLALLFFKRYTI